MDSFLRSTSLKKLPRKSVRGATHLPFFVLVAFIVCVGLPFGLHAQPAPPPTITQVSPNYGTTNGGTIVAISGTGFQPGLKVNFGSLPATFVSVANNNLLTAVTPPAPIGSVDILITNADGQSAVLSDGFSYYNLPIYNWTTIAGTPAAGSQNGTNQNAHFIFPQSVAVDTAGNIFIANGDYTIRKLTPVGTDFVSTTIAGRPGIAGTNDGVNGNILFNQPSGLAVDASTNVYVVDGGNRTVRKLSPVGSDWISSTIAGTPGLFGTTDGTNADIRFYFPERVVIDSQENLFISDQGGDNIRKLTPVGTNWISSTIGGGFGYADGTNADIKVSRPEGMAFDAAGNLYLVEGANHTVRRYTPSGTNWISSTIAGANAVGSVDGTNGDSRFFYPISLTVDANTNIYIADSVNSNIRQLTLMGTNWISSTIAGLAGLRGSNDGIGSAALFSNPSGILLDNQGNLVILDSFNNAVRRLHLSGTNWVSSTIAGQGGGFGSMDGINNAATFSAPGGICLDAATNLYVGNNPYNTIRKVSRVGSGWMTTTIAGQPLIGGTNNGTNTDALFRNPTGIASDTNGNLYIADQFNYTIRKLAVSGGNYVSSRIAGDPGFLGSPPFSYIMPNGVAVDLSGNVYVVDEFNCSVTKLTAPSYSPTEIAGPTFSGTPGTNDGTGTAIRFSVPQCIAIDGRTNLYITDYGNHTIRKLTPTNGSFISTTIAGLPGVSGNADGTNNFIRFLNPVGIAADAQTNLYVGDAGNFTIRKLTRVGTNWVSSTIGGQAGVYGFADGVGGNSIFTRVTALCVDASGNIFLTDAANNVIRMGTTNLARVPFLPPFNGFLATNGNLQLHLTGAANQTYILQAAANLIPPVQWKSIGTNVAATNGVVAFTPTNSPAATSQYYRLTIP